MGQNANGFACAASRIAVSGGDRAAHPMAKVAILKRDLPTLSRGAGRRVIQYIAKHLDKEIAERLAKQKGTAMSELEDIAKANQRFAIQEQEHALRMFPESKSVGEALAKWHETAASKKVQSAYLQHSYEVMQKRNPLGNGDEVVKSRTETTYRQSKPGDNGDGMDDVDWSDDKQATAAYRREKMAKERSRGYLNQVPSDARELGIARDISFPKDTAEIRLSHKQRF